MAENMLVKFFGLKQPGWFGDRTTYPTNGGKPLPPGL